MVTYILVDANFQDKTDIKSIIKKIDNIINSLLDTALKSVLNGDTVEYTLDTGQTKINKVFSSTSSVTKAIEDYRKLRQVYANMLSSRVIRLVDSKNFNNGNYGR